MTEPLLELASIHKTYGRGDEAVVALDDVSLRLWAGEIVAVVGRSGSGKTTLLNVVAGWELPDAGTISWQPAGEVLDWSRLGVVPQSMGLMGELTLRENAEYPLRLARRKDKPDDLEALLQRLGIAAIADRFPHQASLGEQQRAAVARALILEPPLVLLDEPTSHLDSERARALFAELLAAADRGTACLVATHARDVVRNAARVVAMEEGSLRESDHA